MTYEETEELLAAALLIGNQDALIRTLDRLQHALDGLRRIRDMAGREEATKELLGFVAGQFYEGGELP